MQIDNNLTEKQNLINYINVHIEDDDVKIKFDNISLSKPINLNNSSTPQEYFYNDPNSIHESNTEITITPRGEYVDQPSVDIQYRRVDLYLQWRILNRSSDDYIQSRFPGVENIESDYNLGYLLLDSNEELNDLELIRSKILDKMPVRDESIDTLTIEEKSYLFTLPNSTNISTDVHVVNVKPKDNSYLYFNGITVVLLVVPSTPFLY